MSKTGSGRFAEKLWSGRLFAVFRGNWLYIVALGESKNVGVHFQESSRNIDP